MTAKRTSGWVVCECDATPCVCYTAPPRIGPTDQTEAERLRDEMTASGPPARAWLADYIEQNGDELAEAMRRPVEDLISEILDSRRNDD